MKIWGLALGTALLAASAVQAEVIVEYGLDMGGTNPNGPSGLLAQSTFAMADDTLTIVLRNTSTGVPDSTEETDSLLVSLGFDLGDVIIMSGNTAVIAPGSVGLGGWGALGAGDSVAGEWLWTNEGGGDLLEDYTQVISTSQGFGAGTAWTFDGVEPLVSGPFGGIAADPVLIPIPGTKPAVSNAIVFELTLSRMLSEAELAGIAASSIVEFGSDYQYLAVPAPGVLGVLALAGIARRRRRA